MDDKELNVDVIECQECRNQQAVSNSASVTGYVARTLERHAEEYECAMMVLDDMMIPREDEGGNVYSLVGRIGLAVKMAKET
jgi:hypothetical protein